MARSGVKITGKGLAGVGKDLRLLSDVELLVGFPQETTQRQAEEGEAEGLTNAAVAYVHDNGAPEIGIPARPFMQPALKSVEDKVKTMFGAIAKKALDGGGSTSVEQGFHTVGLMVKLAIQNKINEGIPPPLSPRTLSARARKGRTGTKPLVDTGQMRNAADYAIRARKKWSK